MQSGKSLAAALLAALLAMLAAALFAVSSTQAQSASLEVDPALEQKLDSVGDAAPVTAVLTYEGMPTEAQVEQARQTGVTVHQFDELPMLGVEGTSAQVERTLSLEGVQNAHLDKPLDLLMDDSRPLIGADRVENELGYTGKDVGVAVIDSGIDGLHPDVKYPERTVQNVKIAGVPGTNGLGTVNLENVPNTDTTSGHGTHVAGTIGGDGSASNGKYTGVAPGSDLIGIGAGDGLSILYALEGFDYALQNQEKHNIQVINNSWGTTGEFDPEDPINVASKEAHDAGMTVAFAAGNAGPAEDTLNPYSVAPWVIGVAAGEKDGETLSDFSSRGRPGSDLYHPTLTAPGSGIVSARASTGVTVGATSVIDDVDSLSPALLPYYTTLSGTSMATPHVAGTIALMEEANPSLTPDEAKNILTSTADPMNYAEYEAGAGYLDAYEAVQAAEAN